MPYERIDESETFDGKTRESHELRYLMASYFIQYGDDVLDAGCGSGYGADLLSLGSGGSEYNGHFEYFGVDKNLPEYLVSSPPPRNYKQISFNEDVVISELMEFGLEHRSGVLFNVFIGLEIIEHLEDNGVKNFVRVAKMTKRTIIVSTPIIPNSNPYHVQQFSKQDILDLFVDDDWRLEHYFEQNEIYGFFVFKRNNINIVGAVEKAITMLEKKESKK